MSEKEEKAILTLWRSNERKRFGQIRRELSKKLRYRYDQKQIARYLKRLVEKGSLNKYEDEQGFYYVPSNISFVREYRLSSYFNKVRNYSVSKGWFTDKDVGALSVCRIGFYGIPEVDLMTHLESSMLGTIALQLKRLFLNYKCLCNYIAIRMEERSSSFPYSKTDLFYDLLFDLMIERGKQNLHVWDDMGIDELSSMVPDFLDFMNEMRKKYGSIMGRHEIKEEALDKALKLLEIPRDSDASERTEPSCFDFESYDPDMLAFVATTSPRTLDKYASHPENVIKEWWTKADGTEFSSERIREIIEMEKRGINIVDEQERQGIQIPDMCFGLEDLVRYFTFLIGQEGLAALKIKLNADVVSRLKTWDWLIDKIGDEGVERLLKLVKLRDKLGI